MSASCIIRALVLLTGAASSFAQTSPVTGFTYQGRLKATGMPVNGTADFSFSLFDAAADGNAVGGAVVLSGVPVADGLFTVELDFGASAFNGEARWLQIKVRSPSGSGEFALLSPRQPLTPAPFALHALNASGGSGPWQISGAHIYNGNAGNVGIGTSTPHHRLRISGGPTWTLNGWAGAVELENASAMAWRSNPAGQRFGIGQSGGGLYFFKTTSDPGTASSIANYVMTLSDSGYAGIGTTTPGFPLTVFTSLGYGLVHTDGTREVGSYVNASGGWLGTRSNHPLHLFTNNSAPQVTVSTAGRVGIGTTGPTNPLTVIATGSDWAISGQGQSGGVGVAGSATGGANARGVYGTVGAGGFCGTSGDHFGSGNYGLLGTQTEGVYGRAPNGVGVKGSSDAFSGIHGTSANSYGVYGWSSGYDGAGVLGGSSALNGYGVFSVGNMGASGSKSFVIDHPLDPENKTLKHFSAEGPEPQNIYNGVVTTDAHGNATVALPDYFQEINRDYRYQLTVIGQFAQAIVSKEVENNAFAIKTDKPNVKVSWEVKGVRNDRGLRMRGFRAEEEKPAGARGRYFVPEAYGLPRSRGIHAEQDNDRPSPPATPAGAPPGNQGLSPHDPVQKQAEKISP